MFITNFSIDMCLVSQIYLDGTGLSRNRKYLTSNSRELRRLVTASLGKDILVVFPQT